VLNKEIKMRDTKYAAELATAQLGEQGYARIEKLSVKGTNQEELQFSWSNDGRLMMSPLDLPEDQFLDLLGEALNQDVFSDAFKLGLLKLLLR
jgi:hypothetical protein